MYTDDIRALRLGISLNFPKGCGEELAEEAIGILDNLVKEKNDLQALNRDLIQALKDIKECGTCDYSWEVAKDVLEKVEGAEGNEQILYKISRW